MPPAALNTMPSKEHKIDRKEYQSADTIRANLIALRDEMERRVDGGAVPTDYFICLLKINSCLFSKYPIRVGKTH